MKYLLEIKDIEKSFDKRKILNNINLKIEENKIVGLLGANGVGKSTLIKLITGLLTPDRGEILIDGKNIGKETKSIVSFLPERNFLDKEKTIEEEIKYFEDFFGDFDSKKAKALIKDLNLNIKSRISTLSKGMQEKVQLCLIMSRHAKLYILDEPLGGVDPATRDYILDTILSNFDEGSSMIISTHLISDIERILDDVIFINNGEITLQDSADKLRKVNKMSIDEIFRKEFKNAR